MIVLKERLSRLGKAPLLLLRALTAAAIFLVMYQSGGPRNIPLALLCAVVGCLLVYLCDFRVNGVGAAFGLLMEYYAFRGTFADDRIQLAMLAVSYILLLLSFSAQKGKRQKQETEAGL